ncbi:hypothetical protein JIN77_07300 [Verrucomicrobiaceae bacterium R5-34]|nr:hypothetical protein [Verrucomicrobiaceae bacterium R5-34]
MSIHYTDEELTDILQRALDALGSGRYDHVYRRPSEPFHMARGLTRLNACWRDGDDLDEDDYWLIIIDCLEAALLAPLKAYKCPEEPICSHPEALDLEMFAFVIELPDFTRAIYTKFCLKELSDGTWYISIGCHT